MRQPESASSTSTHSPSASRYWTRKRIDSRAPFGVPGIDARMPIASGCLAVSQTLIVAQGSESFAAAVAGKNASAARITTTTHTVDERI